MAVQLDDMNPGITLTGLFWTTAVPENSVEVDFGKGRAELRVENDWQRQRTVQTLTGQLSESGGRLLAVPQKHDCLVGACRRGGEYDRERTKQ